MRLSRRPRGHTLLAWRELAVYRFVFICLVCLFVCFFPFFRVLVATKAPQDQAGGDDFPHAPGRREAGLARLHQPVGPSLLPSSPRVLQRRMIGSKKNLIIILKLLKDYNYKKFSRSGKSQFLRKES